MIQGWKAKNHAGMVLAGDNLSLRALYDLVHKVSSSAPFLDGDDWFLGLAYDVRQAMQGARLVMKPPEHFPEIGTRYGVPILWPVILTQAKQLRDGLAYTEHGKTEQGLVYSLEGAVEQALREDFGLPVADEVIAQWSRIHVQSGNSGEFSAQLSPRGGLFCSWTKAQRKQMLPQLLASLNGGWEIMAGARSRTGLPNTLLPEALDEWVGREWPDPRMD